MIKLQTTMKQIIITFFILASGNIDAFSQSETWSNEELAKELQHLKTNIQTLNKENASLKSEIGILYSKLSNAYISIDSLRAKIQDNSNAITQTGNQLGIQIKKTGDKNEGKIAEVSESLSKSSFFGIIGVLSAILLSGLLYWLLSRRQKTDKTEIDGKLENKTSTLKSDVISEIEKTKKELQQENIRLDLKLIEMLENQLKGNDIGAVVENTNGYSTIDHSIPLKVADEITRINAYANTLDPNSQDSKALKSSVKRLINTFKASQYEIIDLLGQKYDDGMKVAVINEIDDSKLVKDERIIVRIIKPLVKYKGEQIQAAQVDVANGI